MTYLMSQYSSVFNSIHYYPVYTYFGIIFHVHSLFVIYLKIKQYFYIIILKALLHVLICDYS